MPELLIFRHAKSDWHAGATSDISRPLNGRGRRAAARMGELLSSAGRLPDLILCSTAQRTRETLERAQQAGAWPSVPTHYCEDLYGADVDTWIDTVERRADASRDRVLVVGHEPTCSDVTHTLCGAAVRFPTAAVAALQVADLTSLRGSRAVMHWFVVPRLLP